MHPSVRKARRNAKTARAAPMPTDQMFNNNATRVRATGNSAGGIKTRRRSVRAIKKPKIVVTVPTARRHSRIVVMVHKVRVLTGRAGDRE